MGPVGPWEQNGGLTTRPRWRLRAPNFQQLMSAPRADPDTSSHSQTQSQSHPYRGPSCTSSTIISTSTLQDRGEAQLCL